MTHPCAPPRTERCNFLSRLPAAEVRSVRKMAIEMVLASDMKQVRGVGSCWAVCPRPAPATATATASSVCQIGQVHGPGWGGAQLLPLLLLLLLLLLFVR